MNRRDIIKAFAGIPVLGIFGHQFYKKQSFKHKQKEELLAELDLNDLIESSTTNTNSTARKDLVRIGLIGYGKRGSALARGLGFAHPDWISERKKDSDSNFRDTRLQDWFEQDDLNVIITAICDVFDLHRENGKIAAQNDIHSKNIKGKLPLTKVYKNYHDLLLDPGIDAVVIATPDHWHAPITIDAVKSGKHVYCEKCMTRTEEEVYEVEKAVKESGVVFQLGHQYHQSAAFAKARDIIRKKILGKITLVEATSNRNSPQEAWIRHLDIDGNPRPGDLKSIDWDLWLGSRPNVPFSIDRYYNWTKWWDYGTGISGQLFGHEYDAVNNLLNLGIPSSCVASGGIYYYKDNREIPDLFNAVFEFDDNELTFMYSASLANSRQRGRVFMGHDASMELGNSLDLQVDSGSTRFKDNIARGMIDPSKSLFTFKPGMEEIDAITSATERYYADRGLTYTYRNGRKVDTTYLHLKEWLSGIRDGIKPSVSIEKGVEATIACHMATKSYREKRRVIWDPVKRRIV